MCARCWHSPKPHPTRPHHVERQCSPREQPDRLATSTRYELTPAQTPALETVRTHRLHTPAQPFADTANWWIDEASLGLNLHPDSITAYTRALRKYATPVIGTLPMGDVVASDVVRVLSAMADRGLSPSYRHTTHKAISHVFRAVINDGLPLANPTRLVPAPKGSVRTIIVPDRVEVVTMIAAAQEEQLRTFVMIAAATGLRISEILALQWPDVNYSRRSSVRRGKGGRPRAALLPTTLSAQLQRWRTLQARSFISANIKPTNDWVIASAVGTQMDANNWRRLQFSPLAARICPGVTPHSLRHAFATILIEEGIPLPMIANAMGHTNTRITEAVYSHVTARLQAEAADAIDRALTESGLLTISY